jgi:carbonic anhydrase
MSMNRPPKLPHHGFVFGAADHIVQEQNGFSRSARRRFLQLATGGALMSWIAGVGSELSFPEPVSAQSALTPDAALGQLMAGNERFTTKRITSDAQDLAILKQNTAEKQEPFAAVLSCADSRVPVELVFDQTIGHIFVTRVAGNVITPEIIASLEYGAAVLGTKVLLVMGHANCGAVKATIQGKDVPGQISALYPHIQRLITTSRLAIPPVPTSATPSPQARSFPTIPSTACGRNPTS